MLYPISEKSESDDLGYEVLYPVERQVRWSYRNG